MSYILGCIPGIKECKVNWIQEEQDHFKFQLQFKERSYGGGEAKPAG